MYVQKKTMNCDYLSMPSHKNLNSTGQLDGLVKDCSISIALAMEILQSCTKPLNLSWRLFDINNNPLPFEAGIALAKLSQY